MILGSRGAPLLTLRDEAWRSGPVVLNPFPNPNPNPNPSSFTTLSVNVTLANESGGF